MHANICPNAEPQTAFKRLQMEKTDPEVSRATVERALGYPYPRPVHRGHSFVFINGRVVTFRNEDWGGIQGLAHMQVSCQDCNKLLGKDVPAQPPDTVRCVGEGEEDLSVRGHEPCVQIRKQM